MGTHINLHHTQTSTHITQMSYCSTEMHFIQKIEKLRMLQSSGCHFFKNPASEDAERESEILKQFQRRIGVVLATMPFKVMIKTARDEPWKVYLGPAQEPQVSRERKSLKA